MRFPVAIAVIAALAPILPFAYAGDTIGTDTVYTCDSINATVEISQFHISYSKQTQNLTFNLVGQSTEIQNVTATIAVNAYNMDLFSYTFDPCEYDISYLCPVPEGSFSASGQVAVPSKYASQIPSIAFSLPDLDGSAKLTLNNTNTSDEIGCFQSTITNGKTAKLNSVTYASAAIAAVALAVSTVTMATNALTLGASSAAVAGSSIGFTDVMSWTQSMAMNGMMSVDYPTVYSSYTRNFGWATCMISWGGMQKSIDTLRRKTGGDTTLSSWSTMQSTSILDYKSGAYILVNESATDSDSSLRLVKRLSLGGIDFSTNGTVSQGTSTVRVLTKVEGIARYIEHLMVPSANSFMTVLMFFAIILAAVVGSILLFRVFLEVWDMLGSLPPKLEKFRKRYWTFLGSTLVRVIMILYGTWVLYCLYQFKTGDSWVALLLAGLTLGIFTAVLLGFTIRIFVLARRASKQGGIDELYDHKPWIRKYGFFYGQFKTKYWWFFLPLLALSFGRSAFIALGDGSGMVQVAGQLALELVFIISLLFLRPFNTKSGNIINSFISVVRITSLSCILVFVEELGVEAETTTIVGIVLIVVQAVLTVLLALLIVIQAIIQLFQKSPRRTKIEIDETELQPLGESKSLFDSKDYSSSMLNLDSKETRGTDNSGVGVAVTEYEPLVGSGSHSMRRNPWDIEHGQFESSLGVAKTDDHAGKDSWARGGLERDMNGRPMF